MSDDPSMTAMPDDPPTLSNEQISSPKIEVPKKQTRRSINMLEDKSSSI